jgi:hypothetical protein
MTTNLSQTCTFSYIQILLTSIHVMKWLLKHHSMEKKGNTYVTLLPMKMGSINSQQFHLDNFKPFLLLLIKLKQWNLLHLMRTFKWTMKASILRPNSPLAPLQLLEMLSTQTNNQFPESISLSMVKSWPNQTHKVNII